MLRYFYTHTSFCASHHIIKSHIKAKHVKALFMKFHSLMQNTFRLCVCVCADIKMLSHYFLSSGYVCNMPFEKRRRMEKREKHKIFFFFEKGRWRRLKVSTHE